MALSKPLNFNLFLTTVACVGLAACGGRNSGNATGRYNGESVASRTAQSQTANQSGQIHARLAQLENDVAGLKTDFSQLAMSYNGLMTTNDRIDSLLTKMEHDRAAAPVPPVAVVKTSDPKPVVKPVVKQAPKAAPKPDAKPASKTPVVSGVRLGEHGDKTRMVIDANMLGAVQTDLDNTEKLLIITVPKTGWDAKQTVSGLGSPLVSGWDVQDSGGNKTIAVQLKKAVKIIGQSNLKAEGGKPARFILDLASAS